MLLKLKSIFILPLFALSVSHTEANMEVTVQVHIGSTPGDKGPDVRSDQCTYSTAGDGQNVNVIVNVPSDKNEVSSHDETNEVASKENEVDGCGKGYEYVERGDESGCYKFHTQGTSWPGANDTCVREGTHLVIINNRAERDLLVEFYRKYEDQINADEKRQVSVGVYKDEYGQMMTVEGKSIMEGYAYWGTDYRQNYEYLTNRDLKYVFLFVEETNENSHLINRMSFRRYPFICEM